jgi:hypothetical protein
MRVAILLLVIALGLAGCGTDYERLSASGALARADAGTRDVGSVRVRTTMRGLMNGQPTRSHGEGYIDFRKQRMWLSATATVAGRDRVVETIDEQHASYMRIGPSRTDPGGGPWTVLRTQKAGGPTRIWMMQGGRNPVQQLSMFAYLRNVGHIGTERIGDVLTTRYAGEAKFPGFQLETIDFWVDAQWRIRRLRTMTISNQWRATTTTEFYDYGKPIAPITAPKHATDIRQSYRG